MLTTSVLSMLTPGVPGNLKDQIYRIYASGYDYDVRCYEEIQFGYRAYNSVMNDKYIC